MTYTAIVKNVTFNSNCCGYFLCPFGIHLATFCSNIWSHWQKQTRENGNKKWRQKEAINKMEYERIVARWLGSKITKTTFLFFKKGHSWPLSFIFCLFITIKLTLNKCSIKICRCLDSNRGPLVSEVIALATEPQPLPDFFKHLLISKKLSPAGSVYWSS